jgi:hypothetical protein
MILHPVENQWFAIALRTTPYIGGDKLRRETGS